ncbi:hypothetical protein G6O67_005762 [Ophiocordyceps sinensis]|uniref:Uncharacterized protein n=1 Tax=Ophiocordyceps sinensis TaxID=72228 RepID=A0A8H4LXW9_9HYPO|nr:hypothetical protein G6O67_005762 [Ophiocordyceps sinensis]
MPSSRLGWFARHCTPPPPLGNSSACPCAACFNMPTPEPQLQARRRSNGSPPSSPDPRAWRRSAGADALFGSGAQDPHTTTTHIEWVAK